MQIEVDDRLYQAYLELLGQRSDCDAVSRAVERLIWMELRQHCAPGYQTDPLTQCKTSFQLSQDVHETTWGSGHGDESLFTTRYLCIDIDDFRSYAYIHGIPGSDAVLALLGEQLRHRYPGASVYRIGGDEFVVELAQSSPVSIPSIPGITLKHSVVEVSARRDRRRLHHLHRLILFHLDEGIVTSSPEGTTICVRYPVEG